MRNRPNTYVCKCKRVIGKEDRRRKNQGWLVACSGAKLEIPSSPKIAPRLTCVCGRVTVIVKGSV